ncbi:response regulator transcription factor [Primorskyibacter flagellatus]|uniref:DNA-binding response regulator, OmpR family, contains REC and winged-helix (WHTH) domain n=1 Tax=Primorskyibacter flagellatus TaxID=1387277 RepID=A0A1W2AV47_9RHOB|nr:response regulator transcription factor [Primorskyibacter flagellatus]SMC64565.1 DNA-binding response regulator, OmpR family, contains REC and winged-helix (wHTH) domain [Primorskyibacter flagellatus]
MTTRLLIVDDDPGITAALARGLALHGYIADTENRADRALERLMADQYDGAIFDVMLGEENGIDVVRSARAGGIVVPIIMLSALSDVDHRAAGLEAGADDYIVKPFSFDELVARLRVQEKRAMVSRPAPAVMTERTRCLRRAQGETFLTEREFSLLRILADNAGSPVSRGQIFDMLWATDGSGTENVVDVYIGYLRKKIAGQDFGFEIRTQRNRGFCLEGLTPVLG